MVYGKVNERGIPANPKRGWYKVQIDTGTLWFNNGHRKGTKIYKKTEEKYLNNPEQHKVIEAKAFLYKSDVSNNWHWDHCVYLNNYAGYHIKVIGAKRIPECYQ